ncbi:XRE family transcriptional regulator [Jonesiaceae bacterium BS-20]|uniref:XRE family transcriptional regulator n=1 Tax=Jonesiaceae bacterium BS-20 TaxID=3120821 RepID=A0AAU7DWW8_9MICO
MDLRDLRGVTQVEVAREVNVTQAFLSRVEKGERPLPETMASELAEIYGLPVSFFRVVDSQGLGANFTFWKKSRATVRDERRIGMYFRESERGFAALSQAQEQKTFTDNRHQIFELAGESDDAVDPELLAAVVRDLCGLGAREPVRSITRVIERLGIGVIAKLDDRENMSDHLGISRPHSRNSRPVVAVVAKTSGEELRFALGHELGHLLFDNENTRISGTRSEEEYRAHAFSSALFVSNSEMRSRVHERLPLHGFLPIKADYGIGVKALIVRSYRLGLISSDRYRSLMIQYSSRGWNHGEPVEVGQEKQALYRQLMENRYGPSGTHGMADDLGIEQESLKRWVDYTTETKVNDKSNVISLFGGR